MAAAGSPEPARDLYQVLEVARDASREEIALAWRRRARDEHPDARGGDPGAPARFRAVADAWHVLGDPARRAAYDRELGRDGQAAEQPPAMVRVTVRQPTRHPGDSGAAGAPRTAGAANPPRAAWMAEPPLAAGPVWVEGGPRAVPRPEVWDEDDLRLALLAALIRRYRGRPW
jgi:curved DNA-binding protein CbpA